MRNSLLALTFCLPSCAAPKVVPRPASRPPAPPPAAPTEPAPSTREAPPPTRPDAAARARSSAIRDMVVPTPAERTFGPIEWLPGAENGFAVADELDRPLALWIMSADPLSCDCPGELAGRRGNLGDPAVAPLLAECVGAADIVWRMQTSDAPAARHFRGALDAPPTAGIHVLSPGGVRLGTARTLDVPDLEEALGAALEAWFALEPADRALPPASGVERWTTRRPDTGLVLTAWGRDLGPARGPRFRRDQVWVERPDALALVPPDPAPGASADASALARAWARGAFLDDVRGAVAPFADAEVERARLTSEVVSVGAGGAVELLLYGATRAVAAGVDGPRGVETTLVGAATFDPDRGRFTAFDLVAEGERWGRTESNARRGEEAPSPIGFVLERTTDEALRLAAPRAVVGEG
ncbi:MAG: hypothetical protein ACF8XB_18565 [Planctomycetota bacterium JB042]